MMYISLSNRLFRDYLNCKYKAHMKLAGQTGQQTDFEAMNLDLLREYRPLATKHLLRSKRPEEICENPRSLQNAIKDGYAVITNATITEGHVEYHFDALIRTVKPLPQPLYFPVLFLNTEKISKADKLVLTFCGSILRKLQGVDVGVGKILHGRKFAMSSVQFAKLLPAVDQATREIIDLHCGGDPPPLRLNNHCSICEFREQCYATATEKDDLSLLQGLSTKDIGKLNNRGIFSVTQYSYTFRPRRRGKRNPQQHAKPNRALQARAIRDRTVYVTQPPAIPSTGTTIYLDVEGLPDRDFYYLIGLVVKTATTNTAHSFWAANEQDEQMIWAQFIDMLSRLSEFTIFHYGSYESHFLKMMRKRYGGEHEVLNRLESSALNVLSAIYGRVVFPVYSNSLKNIGSYLGYSWTDRTASGLNSIVWRERWEKTGDSDTKRRILTYNHDDCFALMQLVKFLETMDGSANETDQSTSTAENANLSFVDDLPANYSRPDWGTPKFENDDLAHVSKCAYFDYQRDKVYVRTNSVLKNLRRKNKRRSAKRRKPRKLIELECLNCPECGSHDVTKKGRNGHYKLSYGLNISSRGITRLIQGVAATKFHCTSCGNEFLPEHYVNLVKYRHALKSWAMYEHVAHRVSFSNLEEMFRELFGLPVCFRHIHVFKRLMATKYKKTRDAIQRKLASGALVHADETEFRLKDGRKGYVWVFTDLEDVLYMYKPSRCGEFLKDMLKGFSGVLVSDFYSAYDSLNCIQQKCLVHLIRDMNTLLLRNPFDSELKQVLSNFGRLLRATVATIDQVGLKRRHLRAHRKEADRFLDNLSGSSFRSEAAQTVQNRITRYREKLFTFLDYDGVPWNNNNAEHAIKGFAYYREVIDGKLSEKGLEDYLVLLSIYQSCKYKGLSFLQFLLSREGDLDSYSKHPRRRRQRTEIETSASERSLFGGKRR